MNVTNCLRTNPQLSTEQPAERNLTPLQTMVGNLFKGLEVNKKKSLKTLVTHARRLGFTDDELRSLAISSHKINFIQAVNSVSKMDFTNSGVYLRRLFIRCYNQHLDFDPFLTAFNTLVTLDREGSVRFVLEMINEFDQSDLKACAILFYDGLYPLNTLLQDQLKKILLECSYEVQLKIFLQVDFYETSWFQEAILERTLAQPRMALHQLYLLFQRSSQRCFTSARVSKYFLAIVEKFTNLIHNRKSLDILNLFLLLRAKASVDRVAFDPMDRKFITGYLYNHIVISLFEYLRYEKCETIESACRNLILLYLDWCRDTYLENETVLLLQALQNELKIDLSKRGKVHYAPEKTLDDLPYHFVNSVTAKTSIPPKRARVSRDTSPMSLAKAVLNISRSSRYESNLCQNTLSVAKAIYLDCDPCTRSIIRGYSITFYARMCGMSNVTANIRESLKNQIIHDFELEHEDCHKHYLEVLNKFNRYLEKGHDPVEYFESIKALMALCHSLDSTGKGCTNLIDHILLNIPKSDERSTFRYIKGFILPILSYESSLRLAKILMKIQWNRLYELLYILNLPELDADLKQYVIKRISENNPHMSAKIVLPFLKSLMHHCRKDPEFCSEIEIPLLQILKNTSISYELAIDRPLLAFVGLVPGDFTLDDLFTVFFKTLTEHEKFQLRQLTTLTVFISEIDNYILDHARHQTLDEVVPYYHYYKELYPKVCEIVGEHPAQFKWKNFETWYQRQHHVLNLEMVHPNRKIKLQKLP